MGAIVTPTKRRRCQWCGRFVAADVRPVTRAFRALAGWYPVTQLLCPTCAAEWAQDAQYLSFEQREARRRRVANGFWNPETGESY